MAIRAFFALILATIPLQAGTPADRSPLKACATMKLLTRADFGLKEFKVKENETYRHAPVVSYSIDADGNVIDPHLMRSSGISDIDIKLLNAIKHWKYKPRPHCPVIDTQMSVTIDLL